MQVRFLETAEIKDKLLRLMESHDEFHWAVAWGSDGNMADRLLANRTKIRKVVFGTHFCQTDPDLLDRLRRCEGARVVPQTGAGTFHPKVFGFASGDRRAAIIGSANFTKAAVGNNVEAGLYLEGREGDGPIDEALSFVCKLWRKWQVKGAITDEFLAAYRRQHEASRRFQRQLESPPHVPRRRNRPPELDLLEMNWNSYEQTIRGATDADTVRDRLAILVKARQLLDGNRFRDLETHERRAIAGMATAESDCGHEHRWPRLEMVWIDAGFRRIPKADKPE